jgi:hypothetical protein
MGFTIRGLVRDMTGEGGESQFPDVVWNVARSRAELAEYVEGVGTRQIVSRCLVVTRAVESRLTGEGREGRRERTSTKGSTSPGELGVDGTVEGGEKVLNLRPKGDQTVLTRVWYRDGAMIAHEGKEFSGEGVVTKAIAKELVTGKVPFTALDTFNGLTVGKDTGTHLMRVILIPTVPKGGDNIITQC